jgi:hypothetical protein
LEDRLVLSGGTGTTTAAATPAVYALTPSPLYQELGMTPPPAAPPVGARVIRLESRPLTKARLRADYRKAVRAATRDLKAAIKSQVAQLDANGATPTAHQMADFNASVAGAVDATALRLSVQAGLLPNASNKLVPAIQNAILGSGSASLASRLTVLAQSGQLSGTTRASSLALNRLINTATQQTTAQVNNFITTTPLNSLSVNTSGQQIPLKQFIGGQIVNMVGNTLGSLAQTFPNVANSMLFPNGTTGTPTQAALNAFNTASNNALNTAVFELGSALSLLPRTSNLVSQIQPMLFGAATGTTGTGTNTFTSLASALQNLQFGSTGFNTAVSNAFGNAFQSLVTPLGTFFGVPAQANLVLPTSGFTSIFGSSFTNSTFFNGFNNGFATGTNNGFIGFGMTPSGFNANFGTGFNNATLAFNQNLGLVPTTTAGGLGTPGSLPSTGLTNGNGTGTTFQFTGPTVL